MVVDASNLHFKEKLASNPLTRSEIIGTSLAAEVFAICDLIYAEDPRITDLRS